MPQELSMTDSVPDKKPVILVVDDSRVIRVAAKKMLGADYETIEASDGAEGWHHVQENSSICVVFTDMQMPEMDGLELLAHIRESDDERIAALPVIIITGQEDNEAAKQRVFDLGATDFVSKPFESIDLISRAKSYAKLNRKVVELEKQSGHDKLTGLSNAASFAEQGNKTFSFAQRHKTHVSLALLEISNFQPIFLSAGKAVAQQILIAVSKRLSGSMRTEDVAARLGVARIALLLPLSNITDTRDVIGRLIETTNKLVFDTGKEKLRVELVCGISAFDNNSQSNFVEMQQQAETALAEALQNPADKVVLFGGNANADKAVSATEITEEDIQQAFKHILKGNHFQIPPEHLEVVVERLQPFMQYIESRNKNQRTG